MEPEHTNLADIWGAQQRQTAGTIDALSMVVASAQPQSQQQSYGPPPSIPFDRAYSECYAKYRRERWGHLLQEEEEEEDEEEEREREDNEFGGHFDHRDREDDEWQEDEPPTTEPSTPASDDELGAGKRRRQAPSNPRPRRRQRTEHTERADYDLWNRGECFLCGWGDKFHDGIEAPHINKMHSIIDDCFGIWSKLEIATGVVRYYEAVVCVANPDLPRLSVPMVLDHLENHTRDARLFLVNRMDEACQLIFMLKQDIVRADGTKDYKALGEYWRAVDKGFAMYSAKLEKMNFNNGKTRDDTRLMSNPIQLMRAFSQRKPQLQHQDDVFRIGKR